MITAGDADLNKHTYSLREKGKLASVLNDQT